MLKYEIVFVSEIVTFCCQSCKQLYVYWRVAKNYTFAGEVFYVCWRSTYAGEVLYVCWRFTYAGEVLYIYGRQILSDFTHAGEVLYVCWRFTYAGEVLYVC